MNVRFAGLRQLRKSIARGAVKPSLTRPVTRARTIQITERCRRKSASYVEVSSSHITNADDSVHGGALDWYMVKSTLQKQTSSGRSGHHSQRKLTSTYERVSAISVEANSRGPRDDGFVSIVNRRSVFAPANNVASNFTVAQNVYSAEKNVAGYSWPNHKRATSRTCGKEAKQRRQCSFVIRWPILNGGHRFLAVMSSLVSYVAPRAADWRRTTSSHSRATHISRLTAATESRSAGRAIVRSRAMSGGGKADFLNLSATNELRTSLDVIEFSLRLKQ